MASSPFYELFQMKNYITKSSLPHALKVITIVVSITVITAMIIIKCVLAPLHSLADTSAVNINVCSGPPVTQAPMSCCQANRDKAAKKTVASLSTSHPRPRGRRFQTAVSWSSLCIIW